MTWFSPKKQNKQNFKNQTFKNILKADKTINKIQ